MTGFLTHLFRKDPAEKLDVDEKTIEQVWRAYTATTEEKHHIISDFKGAPSATRLRELLDNGLIDVKTETELGTDLDVELHLLEHARNIHSIERLLTALMEAETKYDFVHGLLAHLYVVLHTELNLVNDLLSDKITSEKFKEFFSAQLVIEMKIIETVGEYVRTFNSLVAELLKKEKEASRMSTDTKVTYEQFKPLMQKVFYGELTGAEMEKSVQAISHYVQTKAQELYDSGYIHENDHEWRMHDIDIWYVNRNEFISEAKNILEQVHGKQLTVEHITAFVTIFREYINEFGLPLN